MLPGSGSVSLPTACSFLVLGPSHGSHYCAVRLKWKPLRTFLDPSSASSLLSHVLCCKIWPRWPPWTVLSQFSKTCSLGLGFLSEWMWGYHPVVPVTPCLRLVHVFSSPFPHLPEDKSRPSHSLLARSRTLSFWLKIFPFSQVLFPLKALPCFIAPCSFLVFISKIVKFLILAWVLSHFWVIKFCFTLSFQVVSFSLF